LFLALALYNNLYTQQNPDISWHIRMNAIY
jgi:hypothetical protein